MGKCEACRELTKTPPAAAAAAANNNFVFRRHFSFSKEEKPVNVNTKAFCNPSSFFVPLSSLKIPHTYIFFLFKLYIQFFHACPIPTFFSVFFCNQGKPESCK